MADGEYHAPLDVLGVRAPVDFLWRWLQTGEEAYRNLYQGSCLAELSSLPTGVAPDWSVRTAEMLSAVDQQHRLAIPASRKLERVLRDVHAGLPAARKTLEEVSLLFVGDCLFEEAELFLSGLAAGDGLLILPRHVVSKNPLEQLRQIQALRSERFAAVFFSPFTYAFNPDFAQLLELSCALATEARIAEIVEQATRSVGRTLDFLAEAFECPVFVSNASTLQRGTTLLRRVVKSTATARTRHRAAARVNSWLADYVEGRNLETHRHLFVLDEMALAPTKVVQEELGAYLHVSEALHPTRFSERLAATLAEHVQAVSLTRRKLVISDLDNTLWDGAIGEGLGVRHHQDRQRVLRRLKEKGVVLAIASKNDPSAVRWDGGVLDAGCFVASEVSWAPKVQGIGRIYRELNLQPKDAVFIDDRADERSMVKERWPQMHVADPNDARTWRILELWAELLDGEQELDRTALYQQREQRQAAVVGAEAAEQTADMFRRLGLKASLTLADKSAVKRVCELINRTNQWNLNGSRTSFAEVERWRVSPDHRIVTVQVDDKFGPMGTVCVAVLRERADETQIPVFVLSCRVFGFGVETLVLDYAQRLSRQRLGEPRVRGFFTATQHNSACKDMYREHGYSAEDGAWVYSGGPAEKAVPGWFALSGFDV